ASHSVIISRRFAQRAPRTTIRRMLGFLLALLVSAIVATIPAFAQPSGIILPSGFSISVFASGLGGPRFITLDARGTLLVSVPKQGRVVALLDEGSGKAANVAMVATGLDLPHGLAWKNGDLYVAEQGRVLRFRYDPITHKATDAFAVIPSLPRGGNHRTR